MIIIKFFTYTLELNIPFIGIKKNHFGTAMLIDVRKYKVKNIFWALNFITNSNYTMVLNTPFMKAVAINGKP